ncbi:MAG: GlxA family transcriptional regulator [Pseudomonadales bacterium]
MTTQLDIHIIDYPGALKSALYGFTEIFEIAEQLCRTRSMPVQLSAAIYTVSALADKPLEYASVIILPPALSGDYFQAPDTALVEYLTRAHAAGSMLCSACAGAFIIAATGLLDERCATTHWQLAEPFSQRFKAITLQSEKILVEDNRILTAGGLTSWIDLGLEIVAQHTGPSVMRELGKHLIVDTGKREQRYYQSFQPKLNHSNQAILKLQHYIAEHIGTALPLNELAGLIHTSQRTLLRQFEQATTLTPAQYIQRVRIQSACELLENSNTAIEVIAQRVGYSDSSSFRKTFQKITGLSPRAFRRRFR